MNDIDNITHGITYHKMVLPPAFLLVCHRDFETLLLRRRPRSLARRTLVGVVGHAGEREGGAGRVARELEFPARVVGLDSHGVVHVESRMCPGEDRVCGFGSEEFELHELGEDGSSKRFGETFQVVKREGLECAVVPVGAIRDEHVDVRLPVQERSERLDRGDRTRQDIALPEGGGEEASQGLVGDSAQVPQEAPIVEEVGSKPLGECEDVLTVGNAVEEFLFEPVAPEGESLGVAGRTEIAASAGECDEELRTTARAVDATEAGFENSAVEKLPHDLGDPSTLAIVAPVERF